MLAEEARRVLHAGRYPQAEVEALLVVKVEDLLADMPNQLISLPAAASLGGFALQSRAVHVFEEAQRVRRFVEMARADGGADPAQLGDLMNASPTSCRDNYECSSEELDRLVTLARGFGALGARLTGAWWGGLRGGHGPPGDGEGIHGKDGGNLLPATGRLQPTRYRDGTFRDDGQSTW